MITKSGDYLYKAAFYVLKWGIIFSFPFNLLTQLMFLATMTPLGLMIGLGILALQIAVVMIFPFGAMRKNLPLPDDANLQRKLPVPLNGPRQALIAVYLAITMSPPFINPILLGEDPVMRNESIAIGHLKALSAWQIGYKKAHRAYAPDLATLRSAAPPAEYPVFPNNGPYQYSMLEGTANTFSVRATPASPGRTGLRTFFADETGSIRWDAHGSAGKNSPTLKEGNWSPPWSYKLWRWSFPMLAFVIGGLGALLLLRILARGQAARMSLAHPPEIEDARAREENK